MTDSNDSAPQDIINPDPDRLSAGDRRRREFEHGFSLMQKKQERWLAKLRLSRADTEDVIQAANIIAWRNRWALEDPKKFGGWLHRITMREGIRLKNRVKSSCERRELYRNGLLQSDATCVHGVRELELRELRSIAHSVLPELSRIDSECADMISAFLSGNLSKEEETIAMRKWRQKYPRLPPKMRQQLRQLWPRNGGTK